MKTFKYGYEETNPLEAGDLYNLFNSYRIWKHIIAILIHLNKTLLDKYKILEPGCGSGDKLRYFTKLRAKPENCYGMDTSETAINICKTLSPDTMNFQIGSVLDMPFKNNTFDIILCSGLLGCFNDDADVKKISMEYKRIIKDDGIVLVIDINENFNPVYAKNKEVMKKNLRPYNNNKKELELLLSKEFKLLGHMYLFGPEIYWVNGGPAQLPHLPFLEIKMERGEYHCPYSLWAFS